MQKLKKKLVKDLDISKNLKNLPRQKFTGKKKRDMSREKRMYGNPKIQGIHKRMVRF